MAKQMLDSDLVDMQLTRDVLKAVQDAEARGTQGPMIVGSLIGVVVSVGDDCGCTRSDLTEVVALCHQNAQG